MTKIKDMKRLKSLVPRELSGVEYFSSTDISRFDCSDFVLIPGFCDVHVHFREPGFSYKETIKSGSLAAARGGYTQVCTMPNLNPVPDTPDNLRVQLDIIEKDAVIGVLPYGAITKGENGEALSDMEAMSGSVVAFSDDGRGVQCEDMMRAAMIKGAGLNKIIAAHCEANELLRGGYIHDGVYCAEHNHRGICSASEYVQIERDIRLAKETGCAYHVCHISAKESVDIIRRAKAEGVNVTCETAPHYLVLDENDLREDGRFKMNPPLRSREDRLALIAGVEDGTIDMIATDHAPHSAEEKARGLEKSPFGITGLEVAFPLMYTELVKTGIIPLERLIELLVINPRRRFGIPFCSDFSIWNLSCEYKINPDEFISKGKSTPFAGRSVFGRNMLTVREGKVVYSYKQ